MNVYVVFSAFTSSPISFLVTTKASPPPFYSKYASAQYINIISINQKLVCTVYFQAFLLYPNPPNGSL